MFQLTEPEKEQIYLFNSNDTLKEAIRKVLLTTLYSNGTLREGIPADPTRNAAFGLSSLVASGRAVISHEDLGRDLMALTQAVHMVENAYNKLSEIKKEEKTVESPYNEAI
jgi:hypothetical protein